MRVHRLEREQYVPRPLAEVFAFFSQARNLEHLTPGWLSFTVLSPEPIQLLVGTLIEYRLSVHGVPLRWISRIDAWEQDRYFVDRQLRGPYRLWHHRHDFEAVGEGTRVRDQVHYALPLGPLGDIAHAAFVRRDLTRIFEFRQRAVTQLLA